MQARGASFPPRRVHRCPPRSVRYLDWRGPAASFSHFPHPSLRAPLFLIQRLGPRPTPPLIGHQTCTSQASASYRHVFFSDLEVSSCPASWHTAAPHCNGCVSFQLSRLAFGTSPVLLSWLVDLGIFSRFLGRQPVISFKQAQHTRGIISNLSEVCTGY
jgi:hypothetical protein